MVISEAERHGPGNLSPLSPLPGPHFALMVAQANGRSEMAVRGSAMDSTRSYQNLAFQCMKLAEAVDDPVTQDQLVQLSEAYTSLAERAEEKAKSAAAHHHQAG